MLFFLPVLVAGYQLSSDCEANEYLNTAVYECTSCPSNQVPTDDQLGCECIAGYIKTGDTVNLPQFECTDCGPGTIPAPDQSVCIDCGNGSYDQATFTCGCTGTSVPLQTDFQGGYREVVCTACAEDLYPGSNATKCESCPDKLMIRDATADYACDCQTGYSLWSEDTCIPTNEADEFSDTDYETIFYTSNENADGIGTHSLDSDTFVHYFVKAAWLCKLYEQEEGCQVLGNLCVLQLYSEGTEVCELFKEIGDGQSSTSMPWLYYEQPAEDILEATDVQLEVTFDPDDDDLVNKLTFHYAEYALDGTYLGTGKFTDQLILCPHSSDDSSRYREFGTNVKFECSINLEPFITNSETTFFEVFLEDDGGELQDVPVLIRNFRNENGETPNEGNDEAGWRLVRRFYLYDNVSGIRDSYVNGDEPEVVVYPVSATIRVVMRTDESHRIYIPLIVLNYRSRFTSYIRESDGSDTVTFKSEYTMDTDNFWETATNWFIGTNVFTFVVWLVRMYIWTRLNPPDFSPGTYTPWICLKGITTMLGTWAFIHFWYLFTVTGYWFIFYKMQYNVFVVIPPNKNNEDEYLAFEIILGLVVCAQFLWVLDVLRIQGKTNLLFLDWEKPKRVPKDEGELISAIREGENLDNLERDFPVSAWRTIFVANEFNELQSMRYVNVEITLLLVLCLLYGFDWYELSTAKPNLSLEDTNSPDNPVLRFFLTSFLFIAIGYTQKVVRKLLSVWIATPTQNFIDLCAVANISIFVLDETLHGFYIHGVSPTGKAEVSLDELVKALELEERGTARPRGILPEDRTGLQTYEIYIPWKMKQTFENLGNDPIQQEVDQYRRVAKNDQASGMVIGYPAVPTKMDFDHLKEVKSEMNKRFTNYIAMLIKDHKTNILKKSALQRFFNLPPIPMRILQGSPYFYRDTALTVETIFLMGKDFTMLLMDLLVFAYIDFYSENAFIAALCTYIFSQTVTYIRREWGRWNFSRKTLIHSNFLI